MRSYIISLCLSVLLGCQEESASSRKTVFLTNNTYEGLSLGGLEGADTKCTEEAVEANLQGTYKAWLSDRNVHAKNRIDGYMGNHMPYEYYTVNGIHVGSFDDIISSSLQNPININAYGMKEENLFSLVWTGTNYKGEALTENCNDWKGFGSSDIGVYGKSNEKNINWTHFQDGPAENCIKFLKLYCFEE